MTAAQQTEIDTKNAEMDALKAELKALKAANPISLRVSAKGAISIYGIRRFPVTFYTDEWTQILGLSGEIVAFQSEHRRQPHPT